MKTWKVITGTAFFVAPVTATCLDVFGYLAKVEGTSMQPVLNPTNVNTDFVFLNHWQARSFNFTRGEVVSLVSPNNPDQKIIKRIIALEGDKVRTLSYKNRDVRIPKGHCWVEGDHHGHSMDSNYFGPVAMGLIAAKASHIIWPPSRWQRLEPKPAEDRVRPRNDKRPIVSVQELNNIRDELFNEEEDS
jgi:inner membrane protease subunit 2